MAETETKTGGMKCRACGATDGFKRIESRINSDELRELGNAQPKQFPASKTTTLECSKCGAVSEYTHPL